jgi:hypothetical protein
LKSQLLRIDELGVPALFTEAARFQSWLDVEAALAGLGPSSDNPRRNAGFEHPRNVNWPVFRRSLISASGHEDPFSALRPSVQEGTGNSQRPVEFDHPRISVRSRAAGLPNFTWIT